MIKKKIKLYYKNFVSKTFEKIHGKVLLKKNTLNLLNVFQVNDFFLNHMKIKNIIFTKLKMEEYSQITMKMLQ